MSRSKPLPVRTRDEVIAAHPSWRQSTLATADSCLLMARWDLEGVGYDNAAMVRGTLFHRAAAEILRTLWRTGEVSMPTEEAMAILYEVVAQRDVPDAEVLWLPAVERRYLRKCLISLVYDYEKQAPREFNMRNMLAIEERLTTPLYYPDPDGGIVERMLTGMPDAIIGDPPDGLVILDWKTTRQPPAKGPEMTDAEKGDHHDDAEHVSYLGYFQQRSYGLLALKKWPKVERVTLREFYPLAGEARWATIYRKDAEHIERELTALVEILDRAMMGGHGSAMWKPSPGKHCAYCPRPTHCPIEVDVRAFATSGAGGGIASAQHAAKLAGEYVVAKSVGTVLHEALRTWVDVHGPLPVKSAKGRVELRWKPNKSGSGRSFGMHTPDASDKGPADPALEASFAEAKARVSG